MQVHPATDDDDGDSVHTDSSVKEDAESLPRQSSRRGYHKFHSSIA